jgi:hypothetical protein
MNSSNMIHSRLNASMPVKSLVAMALAMFLGGISSAQQPAKPANPQFLANEAIKPRLVRVFRLGNVDASTVLRTVSKLVSNVKELRLAVDQRANSIIVTASNEADLDVIAKLMETLDVAEPAGDRILNRIFTLQHISPVSELRNVLDLVADRENLSIAYDDRGQRIVARGTNATLEELGEMLRGLDQPSPASSTGIAPTPLQVRVVWLATGMETVTAPDDLKPVIAELNGIGITDASLVAQMLINADQGTRPFQALGEALLDGPCNLDVSGSLVSAQGSEDRKLEISIAVTKLEGTSARRICNLETTISAPLGHSVVLGATPSLDKTSVFVIQLMARDK